MSKAVCWRIHVDAERHAAYEEARIAAGYPSRRCWIIEICDMVAAGDAPDPHAVKRELLSLRARVANAADHLATTGADPTVRDAVIKDLDNLRVPINRRLRHRPANRADPD